MKKRKKYAFHVVPNCFRTLIPKFHFSMLLISSLSALENVYCTLKIATKMCNGGTYSFILLKLKEKYKKYLSFVQIKNNFKIFFYDPS